MKNVEGAGEPQAQRENRSRSISIDGEHFVSVPPRLAAIVALGTRFQKRIDRVAEEMHSMLGMDVEDANEGFDRAVDIMRGINCHKTVLFARGDINKELLLAMPMTPETGGHPNILSLLEEHPDGFSHSASSLGEYLATHHDDAPLSVHALRKEVQEGKEVWVPAHSFIFAGIDDVGREVCVHKRGPLLRMKFEVTELSKVIRHYQDETKYRFLVVPMNGEGEQVQ